MNTDRSDPFMNTDRSDPFMNGSERSLNTLLLFDKFFVAYKTFVSVTVTVTVIVTLTVSASVTVTLLLFQIPIHKGWLVKDGSCFSCYVRMYYDLEIEHS
jgi:hypothetical protein